MGNQQLGDFEEDPNRHETNLMTDWRAEPKPEIPELADDYQAAEWPEMIKPQHDWVPLERKISEASFAALKALMRSGIGEPTVKDRLDGNTE